VERKNNFINDFAVINMAYADEQQRAVDSLATVIRRLHNDVDELQSSVDYTTGQLKRLQLSEIAMATKLNDLLLSQTLEKIFEKEGLCKSCRKLLKVISLEFVNFVARNTKKVLLSK
jgi:hypothetical protein